ncbi:HAD family hydrolase [Streptosporangium roseum]|uniref:HAD family hydrolase n=1 Tax=Streptosporangium roseum TaxID=2001 RepID=UPI0004CCDC13|nr:HAD-IIIA family hydrolase [Streptosporangium roseum]
MMRSARYVLLDFDGPICDVFAGLPAPEVADRLRMMLRAAGADLPQSVQEQDDPMEIFRFSAELGGDLNHATLNALTGLEVEAAATACMTPGAADLIRRSKEVGKAVAVVSNNSAMAVTAFLRKHGLLSYVDLISARVALDPELMKPNPHLIQQALTQLDADAALTLLVGDSVTDMQASKSAGITAVGYANKPGKVDLLAAAGADIVVMNMKELASALCV